MRNGGLVGGLIWYGSPRWTICPQIQHIGPQFLNFDAELQYSDFSIFLKIYFFGFLPLYNFWVSWVIWSNDNPALETLNYTTLGVRLLNLKSKLLLINEGEKFDTEISSKKLKKSLNFIRKTPLASSIFNLSSLAIS